MGRPAKLRRSGAQMDTAFRRRDRRSRRPTGPALGELRRRSARVQAERVGRSRVGAGRAASAGNDRAARSSARRSPGRVADLALPPRSLALLSRPAAPAAASARRRPARRCCCSRGRSAPRAIARAPAASSRRLAHLAVLTDLVSVCRYGDDGVDVDLRFNLIAEQGPAFARRRGGSDLLRRDDRARRAGPDQAAVRAPRSRSAEEAARRRAARR